MFSPQLVGVWLVAGCVAAEAFSFSLSQAPRLRPHPSAFSPISTPLCPQTPPRTWRGVQTLQGLRMKFQDQEGGGQPVSRGGEAGSKPSESPKVTKWEQRGGTMWTLKTTDGSEAVPMDKMNESAKSFTEMFVGTVKGIIDVLYAGRDYSRFYVLETVARIPYFAYMSVLHLYESLGLYRKANWLNVHYAQADNELHHLLIMESLGADEKFVDRMLARNMAFFFYWVAVGMYIVNPRAAYYMSELIEDHAFKTYDKFLTNNEAELRDQKAPQIALDYYNGEDHYLFDTFHTMKRESPRRPQVSTLYDVFQCIRDDEAEHRACLHSLVQSGRLYNIEGA